MIFMRKKKYVCMVNNSFVFSYHCWSTWLVSCIFCCQGPHITLFPLPSFNQPLYPTPHMSKSPFPNPVPPSKGSGYRHSPNVISTLSFQLHMNVTCVFRQQEIKEANFFFVLIVTWSVNSTENTGSLKWTPDLHMTTALLVVE